jgi:hypothetical protein
MSKSAAHRKLQIMRGGFAAVQTGMNPKDVPEATLTAVAERIYTLTPKKELQPGEYLITFRGANGTAGYDFGIR